MSIHTNHFYIGNTMVPYAKMETDSHLKCYAN